MKSQAKKISIAFLVLYLLAFKGLIAQDFSRKYDLGKVKKSGLYRVVLSPDFCAVAQANFSDVRLSSKVDSLVEVPYFIRLEEGDTNEWDVSKFNFSKPQIEGQNAFKGVHAIKRELPQEHITQICLFSLPSYRVNQIQFAIQSPEYFSREVMVYTKEIPMRGRFKKEQQKNMLANLELKKGQSFIFPLDYTLTDSLFIDILNLNNPPLEIAELSLKQKPYVLYTYLNKGDLPTLFCGNENLQMPNYDLAQFTQEILKAPIEKLPLGEGKIIAQALPAQAVWHFWQSKEFLWTCLVIAMLFMTYLSIALLKENKKK